MFGRFHDGGAGDHAGAAVIHFGEQAEDHGLVRMPAQRRCPGRVVTLLAVAKHSHGQLPIAKLLADRL
jgi:hypothetical protein